MQSVVLLLLLAVGCLGNPAASQKGGAAGAAKQKQLLAVIAKCKDPAQRKTLPEAVQTKCDGLLKAVAAKQQAAKAKQGAVQKKPQQQAPQKQANAQAQQKPVQKKPTEQQKKPQQQQPAQKQQPKKKPEQAQQKKKPEQRKPENDKKDSKESSDGKKSLDEREKAAEKKEKEAEQAMERLLEEKEKFEKLQKEKKFKIDAEGVVKKFQEMQREALTKRSALMEENQKRITNECYKVGKDFPGKDIYWFDLVESAIECQIKCAELDGCKAWTWYSSKGRLLNKPLPNRCHLKSGEADEPQPKSDVISGPKSCGKGNLKDKNDGNESALGGMDLTRIDLSKTLILGAVALLSISLVTARFMCYEKRREPKNEDLARFATLLGSQGNV